MVLITRHNYEAYLLDYIEGNLAKEETAGLMRFLKQNPDLAEDFNDFDWVTLSGDNISFQGKEEIKIQAEIDELLIGQIEKLNTPGDTARLVALLKANPQFKKQEAAYAATILAPEHIEFPYKSNLKQEYEEDLKIQDEIEALIIGKIENLNTPNDKARLAALLKANPQFKKEEAAYAATILTSEHIEFPYKSNLKQENKIIPLYFWYSAAAACVIGFMATFGWNSSANNDLQYSSNSISTPSSYLAIKKLPDFNALTYFDNSSTDDSDSLITDKDENIFIALSNPIDPKYIASSGSKPHNNSNKKDRNTDPVKVDSSDFELIKVPVAPLTTYDEIATIDSISAKMDSSLNLTNTLDNVSIDSDNITMNNSDDSHSLGEFIAYKTREKVLREDQPTYNAIQTNEVLSKIAKGLDKITASKVSFNQEQTKQGKSTRLKIGKFELYRSAR